MEITKSDIDELLIEGKTKQVYSLKGSAHRNHVYVLSKDRITAGDGVKSHILEGKSILSTQTNCAIFEFLSAVGVKTHFVSRVASSNDDHERSFVALKCEMIPIEWVTRRVATGSYLKRHPHVKEGYRFAPLKQETFFKDDANHDPYWSTETLVSAELDIGGLKISDDHVQEMLSVSNLVFEVLERAWQTLNHSLIDMKIEFGVVEVNGIKQIVVADVIDNDSWRLWPNGEKRLMLDKQIYRNMDNASIDQQALDLVKSKFEVVAERTTGLFAGLMPKALPVSVTEFAPTVSIVVGSPSDREHALKIREALRVKYHIHAVDVVVSSAHKGTAKTLEVAAKIQQWPTAKAVIAVAGMSNGLGPVLAANLPIPVISCPPTTDIATLSVDVWSSLRIPSGMANSTVIGAEQAALAAAHIVANGDAFVWGAVRTSQIYNAVRLIHSKI